MTNVWFDVISSGDCLGYIKSTEIVLGIPGKSWSSPGASSTDLLRVSDDPVVLGEDGPFLGTPSFDDVGQREPEEFNTDEHDQGDETSLCSIII